MSDPISPVGNQGQLPMTAQGKVLGAPPNRKPESPSTPNPAPVPATLTQLVNGLSEPVVVELSREHGRTDASRGPMPLDEAVKTFREYLKNLPSNLQFNVDDASGYVVFKVVNPITQEVIRQYPPDQVLEMAKHIKESLSKEDSGMLLDRKT